MSKSQYFHISSLQASESSAYKITESIFLFTCMISPEGQITSNFASCRLQIPFASISGAGYVPVDRSMADPNTCPCRHFHRNHSPKVCVSQGQLACEENKQHRFGFKHWRSLFITLALLFCLSYICRLHFFPLS